MVLVNFRVAAGVAEDAGAASALISALEGRAAALFVVLAGAGLALAGPARGTLTLRALILFALGLMNLTIFDADIISTRSISSARCLF
ncbi:hypothetical protein [Cribrihabitans pelagius]|uniref:hypothetical protein n=1 Tax=Cribrihabitans pelagius TaxID=1765746 RepID=UPI003B5C2A9C